MPNMNIQAPAVFSGFWEQTFIAIFEKRGITLRNEVDGQEGKNMGLLIFKEPPIHKV